MTSVSGEPWFSDPSLVRVLAMLNADGGEARVAGGAVRNSLLGESVADIDIATTLTPDAVVLRAAAAGIKAVPTGIEHGTVTLVVDGKPFEVTTLRRDVETDGRHATVAFGTDWKADAERRDLTINALYAAPDGAVVDLVDGLADIRSRTVRFIGDPDVRIAEDHLRVLRFFRFFALYGSRRPDADGLRACARAKGKLSGLSAERVWSELKKLLAAPDPGRALLWMRQSGVLTEVLPETEKWGIDAIPGLIAAEKTFGWKPDPMLRLVSILPRDGQRLRKLAGRLRLSKAEAAVLDDWAGAPEIGGNLTDASFEQLLYLHGPRGLLMRLKLALAKAHERSVQDPDALRLVGLCQRLIRRAGEWKRPVFPLKGEDVLAQGVEPGRRVGFLLEELEREWRSGHFRDSRAKLLARLKTLVAEGWAR